MKNRILSVILAGSVLLAAGCGEGESSDSSGGISGDFPVISSGSADSSDGSSSESSDPVEYSESSYFPYDDVVGDNGFVPDYSQTVYTDSGYYIGNHFIENDNQIYNNQVVGINSYRSNVFENNILKYTDEAAVIWDSFSKTASETYDIEAALACAEENWDVGVYLCAPFVSLCLEAGGLSTSSPSSTALCLQLLGSGLGFGEMLSINEDGLVTLPEYARPGDVVQYYCSYEGLMIHSTLYVGNDENGNMRVICRNPRNNGEYAFNYYDYYPDCYDCDTELTEVFIYHFYQESDDPSQFPEEVQNNSNVVLVWNDGLVLDEEYNREEAVEYAKTHIEDGIGVYGAEHLSDCLTAGGISVYYPNSAAVLFQLLASGLGTAHSVEINDDRTVTMPSYVREGDVMFMWCPDEGGVLGSFMVKGADENGRLILYAEDMVNDETKAYRVDDECLCCDSELTEVIFFCFD